MATADSSNSGPSTAARRYAEAAFELALERYIRFYLEHMRLEETVVLPAAQETLQPGDWTAIDAAFASNTNPLAPGKPRDAAYDRLFTRIVMRAPSPIGLGSPS